jgi:NADPH2:quinone reductase
MRAMVIDEFGSPEVLQPRDVERPEPGPDELRVRVIASGTNPVDAKIRAAGRWAGIALPAILGYDVSGVVEAVGSAVEGFAAGDEVFYTPEIFGNRLGSYAEYNVAPAAIVARKPAALSHVDAAAVPLAGGTAWEAVVRRLRLRAGETILVHGGAGGVGSFAVQIAKACGARVLATAGPENQDELRRLGADVAIDYRADPMLQHVNEATAGRGVDAVLDTAGGDNIARSLALTRPFGRLACILPPAGDLGALSRRNLTLFGVFLTREHARLEEMTPLLESGRIKPAVAEVLPLEEVRRAHERLGSGHGRGKIVLRVAEG